MKGKIPYDRLVPMGLDGKRTWHYICGGLGAAMGLTSPYLVRYCNARGDLFEWGTDVLRAGAVMPPFGELLGGAMAGFWLLAASLVLLAAWHYAYHYRESKSIYLMRRLPDRWELWRRCLALPLAGLAANLAAALLVLGIDYGIYVFFTPIGCLP